MGLSLVLLPPLSSLANLPRWSTKRWLLIITELAGRQVTLKSSQDVNVRHTRDAMITGAICSHGHPPRIRPQSKRRQIRFTMRKGIPTAGGCAQTHMGLCTCTLPLFMPMVLMAVLITDR